MMPSRRRAYLTLGFAMLGVVAGSLLVEVVAGYRTGDRTRIRQVRLPVPDLDGARSTREVQGGPISPSTEPANHSTHAENEDHRLTDAKPEPWPIIENPRDRLTRGRSGDYLLSTFEYETGADTGPVALENESDEAATRRVMREGRARRTRYLKQLRRDLQHLNEAGEPPWAQDQFTILGIVSGEAPGFAVPGRQWMLPASPRESLQWYATSMNTNPDETDIEAALRALEDYEVSHQALVGQIVKRLTEIADEKPPGHVRDQSWAYLIAHGRLRLLSGDDSPALRDHLRAYEDPGQWLQEQARRVLR